MKQIIEKFNNLLFANKTLAVLQDTDRDPNSIVEGRANVDDFIAAIQTSIGEDENGTAIILKAIEYDYGYSVELKVQISYGNGDEPDEREYHLYYATKY